MVFLYGGGLKKQTVNSEGPVVTCSSKNSRRFARLLFNYYSCFCATRVVVENGVGGI